MPKSFQCHRQPKALPGYFEIPVPSINDHPIIVEISRKFYENGPCIKTTSFCVAMI